MNPVRHPLVGRRHLADTHEGESLVDDERHVHLHTRAGIEDFVQLLSDGLLLRLPLRLVGEDGRLGVGERALDIDGTVGASGKRDLDRAHDVCSISVSCFEPTTHYPEQLMLTSLVRGHPPIVRRVFIPSMGGVNFFGSIG